MDRAEEEAVDQVQVVFLVEPVLCYLLVVESC